MLVSGLAIFFLLRAALLSGVEKTARDSALAAAKNVDSGEPLHLDEMRRLSLQGVFVVVRDGEGTILTRTGDLPDQAEGRDRVWQRALQSERPIGSTVHITEDAPAYVYAVPVEPQHGKARVVEAGQSYAVTERALETFATVLVGGGLLAFLLAIGGAYLLARAALSPVGAVVASARKITESDLSERLPVTNPKDEIGDLTATMNALLSRLEEAFARREEVLGKGRRFVADASHELRTPLTNIEGYAEMLEEWAL
jgi:signal transduction histidine kinase